MARIIAFANHKGGCGKTTTTTSLAATICEKGYKVLLIDFDPQAHSTIAYGINLKNLSKSVFEVMSGKENGDISLLDVIYEINSRLFLAPSNIYLCAVEQLLSGIEGREYKLKAKINELIDKFDYILIDCPPNLGLLTINALVAANEVVIPVDASIYSYQGLEKLIEVFDLVKTEIKHDIRFYILPTMFNMKTKIAQELLDDLKGNYPNQLLSAHIRCCTKLREAAKKGMPINLYASNSKGCGDYRLLGDEIISLDLDKSKREQAQTIQKANISVSFIYQQRKAKKVYLVGDFNNWMASRNYAMKQEGSGVWKRIINLYPGRYRYKYLVDGKLVEDRNNPVAEISLSKGVTSVIEV
ncbi:MAG: AAA family ATPase [bacterium]